MFFEIASPRGRSFLPSRLVALTLEAIFSKIMNSTTATLLIVTILIAHHRRLRKPAPNARKGHSGRLGQQLRKTNTHKYWYALRWQGLIQFKTKVIAGSRDDITLGPKWEHDGTGCGRSELK